MKIQNFLKLALPVLILSVGFFIPVRVFAEAEEEVGSSGVDTSGLILFVREGCPHCANVEKFLDDNGLTSEVQILDVEADPANAALYTQLSNDAGMSLEEQGGVPLLFDDGEAVTSADVIIEHLGAKFDVETTGYGYDEEKKSNTFILVIFGIGISVSVLYFVLSRKREK
jgi:glutaredoxin